MPGDIAHQALERLVHFPILLGVELVLLVRAPLGPCTFLAVAPAQIPAVASRLRSADFRQSCTAPISRVIEKRPSKCFRSNHSTVQRLQGDACFGIEQVDVIGAQLQPDFLIPLENVVGWRHHEHLTLAYLGR